MITRLNRRNARADFNHHAATLMAQYGRKQPLWISSGERIGVGMTNPGCDHLHHHLTGLGGLQIDLFDG